MATHDPLLEHYAQQYADAVGVTIETARRSVDARPTMQHILGRETMSYAEACRNAGIPVPTDLPEGSAIAEPEPAQVPAEEPAVSSFGDEDIKAAPLVALQHHVTGAIERGEAEALVEVTAAQPGAEVLSTDNEAIADGTLTADGEGPMATVVELRPAPQTNTLVTLTYRARTTLTHVTVLPGKPSTADVRRIGQALICGSWVIPEQLGLANPRRADQTSKYDHPFVELTIGETEATVTQDRSLAELADSIESITWDPTTFTPYQEAAA